MRGAGASGGPAGAPPGAIGARTGGAPTAPPAYFGNDERAGRARPWLVVAAALAGLVMFCGAGAAAPARVVSANVCTDQLAMLLAAPGQLVSVSHLARDPMASAMAGAVRGLPANRGGAEEIFLMRPDLVLAGSEAAQTGVAMLRRLGVRVELFAPERSFADVRANIARMGAVLGREAAAKRMLAAFDARLAALRAGPGPRPRAALYHANGFAPGAGSLADEMLRAAGFANIAAERGITGGGHLPLEVLVTARPDLVVTGPRYPGASRGEALLDHPALAGFRHAPLADARWVCGTPHLLDALEELVVMRRQIGGGG